MTASAKATMADQQGGWIEWAGGECPLEPGTIHDREYRNGRKSFGIWCETTNILRRAMWGHDGVPEDIVRYRIVDPTS